MRVLLASTSGGGHVQPLVSFARALVERGHEVAFVAAPSASTTRVSEDFRFFPGGSPDEEVAHAFWSDVASLGRSAASRAVEREWFAGLCLSSMLAPVERVVQEWRPDLVLREPCEYASAIVADRAGLRHATVGISTGIAESSVLSDIVSEDLDAYSPGLARRLRGAPFLTGMPESLDPTVFPTTIRYRRWAASSGSSLPGWWTDSQAPLVYLTMGTVLGASQDLWGLLEGAATELGRLGLRVLVTTGARVPEGRFEEVPASVHVESWVPQDDVVGAASVVVCHGGSGTTYGALAAGVPLVFLPVMADQLTNARLVAEAGAGVSLLEEAGSALENVAALERAIGRLGDVVSLLLAETGHRDRARLIAGEMAAQPSLGDALGRLAADL